MPKIIIIWANEGEYLGTEDRRAVVDAVDWQDALSKVSQAASAQLITLTAPIDPNFAYVLSSESYGWDCKCNLCYPRNTDDARRRDMPKWIENSYQGCHLIFGGVKQIPPFIVKVSGIIQYISLSKLPSVIWKNVKAS